MLRLIIKFLPVFVLTISSVFADDALSVFNQQGYFSGPEPIDEESFFATRAPVPSKSSGYFGIDLGAGYANLTLDCSIHDEFQDSTLEIGNGSDSERRKLAGYSIGLYAGYGFNRNHFYLGSELGFSYNSLKKDVRAQVDYAFSGTSTVNRSHPVDLSVKQPVTLAFDLMPGYLTQSKKKLFYARFGVGASTIKLSLYDHYNNVKTDANRIRFSYRIGLGVENFVSDTFGLRLEYLYSMIRGRDDHGHVYYYVATSPNNRVEYTYGVGNTGIHKINLGLSIYP